MVLTKFSTYLCLIMLFDLHPGGIVDAGLSVTLADLVIFVAVCEVSPSSLFCLTWSYCGILLSTAIGLDTVGCSVSSLVSSPGGSCDLVLV